MLENLPQYQFLEELSNGGAGFFLRPLVYELTFSLKKPSTSNFFFRYGPQISLNSKVIFSAFQRYNKF